MHIKFNGEGGGKEYAQRRYNNTQHQQHGFKKTRTVRQLNAFSAVLCCTQCVRTISAAEIVNATQYSQKNMAVRGAGGGAARRPLANDPVNHPDLFARWLFIAQPNLKV